MKNKILIYSLLSVFSFSSCDTILDVEEPDFEVTVDKDTYTVGEFVKFNIEGNPEYVNFYSGEPGNDYDYLNVRRKISANFFSFYFSFRYQYATNNPENQFEIYLIKNYTGDRMNYNEIHNHPGKINITDRYPIIAMRSDATTITNKPDLSDIVSPGDSINIVLRYKKTNNLTSGATIWYTAPKFYYFNEGTFLDVVMPLKDFFLPRAAVNENKVPYKSENRAHPAVAPASYTVGQNIILWANSNSTDLVYEGKTYTRTSSQDEYWVSSKYGVLDGFEIKDWAVPIKGYSDARINDYSYVYNRPGVYKVVFEGYNTTVKEKKIVKKEMFITIVAAPI